jgi:hypothetical protein
VIVRVPSTNRPRREQSPRRPSPANASPTPFGAPPPLDEGALFPAGPVTRAVSRHFPASRPVTRCAHRVPPARPPSRVGPARPSRRRRRSSSAQAPGSRPRHDCASDEDQIVQRDAVREGVGAV